MSEQSTKKSSDVTTTVIRSCGERCDICGKPAQLVSQFVYENRTLDIKPFVFRYWLCQWHRSWWNRRKHDGQKKMIVVQFLSDEELLRASHNFV